MGHKPHAKFELKYALSDVVHAKKLINEALESVEKEENKQLIQDTLNSIDHALDATRTSAYGFSD